MIWLKKTDDRAMSDSENTAFEQEASIIAVDLKRIDRGALYGTVCLSIPRWKLKFHEVLWGHTADAREWVRLPAREWTGSDGAKRYAKLISWGDATTDRRFQEAALAAIHQLVDELGHAA